MKIDHHTKVSIGLVITLLAAAISFGVMYQKVDGMGKAIENIQSRVDALYMSVFDRSASL